MNKNNILIFIILTSELIMLDLIISRLNLYNYLIKPVYFRISVDAAEIGNFLDSVATTLAIISSIKLDFFRLNREYF